MSSLFLDPVLRDRERQEEWGTVCKTTVSTLGLGHHLQRSHLEDSIQPIEHLPNFRPGICALNDIKI